MKTVKMILLSALLIMGLSADNSSYQPTLDKNEKLFKEPLAYTLNDFNLAWKVNYFEVVWYDTAPSDGKTFELFDKTTFHPIFQTAQRAMSKQEKKDLLWLSKAILTEKYFWKHLVHPAPFYVFHSLRFLDEEQRFKAIETVQDVKEMLGEIDTPAELFLWIYLSKYSDTRAYSYKESHGLIRVRFLDNLTFSCAYREYFKYYDKQGKVIKEEAIKEVVYEEPCNPPIT